MSISLFGQGRKIRYAIVGLGDISQEALMPGVKHTGNSEITAFVSGNLDKARQLGSLYDVKAFYTYEQFGALLASKTIDAIYLATPNWRHAEFAVPALKAGVHVFLEKPMEVTTAKCQEILDAQKESKAKLMLAYRLHFEPATLSTIDRIRGGELGDLRYFISAFSQVVNPENHRANSGMEAGPLYDMGPYPINAARYLFGDEPIEVMSATSVRDPNSKIAIDDTQAVTLRFPGERLAQFVVSYAGSGIDNFMVVGTKGSLQMNPSYGYGKSLEQFLVVEGKKTHKVHKETDQFGGELKYFSDCILENRDPEPDGEEGYADVRVIEGIRKAIETGQPQMLKPFTRSKRIDTKAQLMRLGDVKAPPTIDATSPSIQAS